MPNMGKWTRLALLAVGAFWGPDMVFSAGVILWLFGSGGLAPELVIIVVPVVFTLLIWAVWAILAGPDMNRYLCAVVSGWCLFDGVV